jgi:uncharacterized protein (TIGR02646 family)
MHFADDRQFKAMIHRARPESGPKSLNLDEEESAAARELVAVGEWIKAGRKTKRPAFKAYKSKDVGPALEQLFERKCAYCESPYASLQPVDVEHWRPKSEIEGVPSGGYEWLAMRWKNLLPSCIDCNRARYQLVPDDSQEGWRREMLGKANQFPIADPANRWVLYDKDSTETPLLLDPCNEDDNPSDYFDFDPSGVLLPKDNLDAAKRRRAVESIRVYALNRKNLVDERLRHILRLNLVFNLVRFLYEASGNPRLPQAYRDAASTLVTQTLDRLEENTLPGVPYSQFIKQRLNIFLRDVLGVR